jgi:hypothetical protein
VTKEEFDQAREFAQRLPDLRHQVADGQLLDRCEQWLRDLIQGFAYIYDAREAEVPPPESEPAHIDDEPRGGTFFEEPTEPPPIPPHLHREPGPPPEPEPPRHVPHLKTPHKRTTTRKTHR